MGVSQIQSVLFFGSGRSILLLTGSSDLAFLLFVGYHLPKVLLLSVCIVVQGRMFVFFAFFVIFFKILLLNPYCTGIISAVAFLFSIPRAKLEYVKQTTVQQHVQTVVQQ